MKLILSAIQLLFKTFLLFLFNIIWLSFLIANFSIAVFLSFCLSVLMLLIITMISKKRCAEKQLKIKEKQECENIFFSLSISKTTIKEFYLMLKAKYKLTKKAKYIQIENQNNTIIYPFINFLTLDKSILLDIISLAKKEKSKKIVIPYNNIDKSLLDFTNNFDIEIVLLDKYETYQKFFKEYDYFPAIIHRISSENKKQIAEIISLSFNKKRTKGYLISAFVLLFCSIFVPYSLYYCIFSALLVLFAIISFFKTDSKNTTSAFEL